MSYINKNHVKKALVNMRKFHDDLEVLHSNYGLSMLCDTGRRNILMSSAQERFFASALAETYRDVINDGKTGEPDVVVGELEKELECKITTPTPSGGINLQTDYATLAKKGALDYLYVIADKQFEKFVVLHYVGLTTGDFSVPCESSRGKAKLVKHIAVSKCNVLWGEVQNKNEIEIEKRKNDLTLCSPKAVKKREKLIKSIKYWQDQPINFKYKFEAVN